MKKLLGIMLTVAMILTLVTMPTVAETTETASFDGDYVAGDHLYASFDASKDEDLAGAFVGEKDGVAGNVVTFEVDGDTYAYASGGDKFLNLPICPGFVTGKTLYVKIRTFATTDVASGDKTAYIYFANTHRLGKSMENSLYTAADENLTLKAAGPGMDNIYAISDTGAWTLYAKHVGSDGPWVEITTGQTVAHVSSNFKVQSGLGISSVKVYTKDAEAALEAAKGAAANCSDGDYVLSTFDASDANDLAKLTVDGGAVKTTEFGDGIYAHAEANQWLFVPQISPAIYDTESVYVKYQLHAIDDNSLGKVLYQYTTSSGNRRASRTLNNSEIGSNRLLTSSANGVEVIFEMTPTGHTNYVRTATSDGVWTLLEENKGYSTNSSYQILQLQYGLGISKAVMYKKVDAATSAFNAASKNNDAAAMATALSTYAANYGIDLTKLDKVEDDNAVYAKLFNMNVATAEEVVAAFDAAVTAQIAAEFDGDYIDGDKVYGRFDASDSKSLASAYVLDGADGSKGTVETVTIGGDTYAYANGGAKWLEIPNCPGFIDGLYIKFRTHAITDASNDKHAYVYFANTHRITKNLDQSLYQAADSSLTLTTAGAGMDNIYAVDAEGNWTLYARQVGSTGGWTAITSGKTSAHTNNKTFKVNGGLGISNILIYTKLPADEAVILLAEDSVTVRNYESGALVLASYESADGRMVDSAVITSGITADTAITISDKLNTNGATVVKAFLWNDMTDFEPICESKIVGLN